LPSWRASSSITTESGHAANAAEAPAAPTCSFLPDDLELERRHAEPKAIDEAGRQCDFLACRTEHNAESRLEPERQCLEVPEQRVG
jgi:hypothetical protein